MLDEVSTRSRVGEGRYRARGGARGWDGGKGGAGEALAHLEELLEGDGAVHHSC